MMMRMSVRMAQAIPLASLVITLVATYDQTHSKDTIEGFTMDAVKGSPSTFWTGATFNNLSFK